MENKKGIIISIRSEFFTGVNNGKTTLAIELAKFLADSTGQPVTVFSEDIPETLVAKLENDLSLEGLEISIEDLGGYSTETLDGANAQYTELTVHPSTDEPFDEE